MKTFIVDKGQLKSGRGGGSRGTTPKPIGYEAGFHPGVLGAPRGAYLISWIINRRIIFFG